MKKNELHTLIGNCPNCAEAFTVEVPQGQSTASCFTCDEAFTVDVRVDAMSKDRPYRDEAWLTTEYTVNERSMADIARQCGVSPMTVFQWLGKHGIPTRNRGGRKQ